MSELETKRVVTASELKAGEQMEADILKALTGNDSLPVRGLRQYPTGWRSVAWMSDLVSREIDEAAVLKANAGDSFAPCV